jgi:hypothetical protein
VSFAVGFASEDQLIAEPEAGGSGLSERPVAPVCGERHDFRQARHGVWAVRNTPWRQFETPGFADHGIFGRAEPAAAAGGPPCGGRSMAQYTRRLSLVLCRVDQAFLVGRSFTTAVVGRRAAILRC